MYIQWLNFKIIWRIAGCPSYWRRARTQCRPQVLPCLVGGEKLIGSLAGEIFVLPVSPSPRVTWLAVDLLYRWVNQWHGHRRPSVREGSHPCLRVSASTIGVPLSITQKSTALRSFLRCYFLQESLLWIYWFGASVDAVVSCVIGLRVIASPADARRPSLPIERQIRGLANKGCRWTRALHGESLRQHVSNAYSKSTAIAATATQTITQRE